MSAGVDHGYGCGYKLAECCLEGRLAGMKNRYNIMDSKVTEQARPSVPRLVDGCGLVAGTRRMRPSLRLAGTICSPSLFAAGSVHPVTSGQ